MANYFRNIPNVQYDIYGTEPNNYLTVTNIMQRVKFKSTVIDAISDYYPYYIREGERPDIVSNQLYGTVAYAYLILLFNNINDPLFDWPLHSRQFENYIISKYGSVANALSNIKHYYQIIRAEVPKTGLSERIPEVKIIVDQTTYNTLQESSRSTISDYEWEDEKNEEKRSIRVIDPDIIQDVDYALKRTFAN